MKKKLFLHIGSEKTGTTTLQNFCSINSAYLNDQGFFYPCLEELPYVNNRAHSPLPASFLSQRPEFIPAAMHYDSKSLFTRFASDMAKRMEPAVIVSAEHFSSRCSCTDIIQLIKSYLSEFDLRIIVYIRPQHEMLLSAYSTYLKNGGTQSLNQIMNPQTGWLHPDNIYFNYKSMLNPWVDTFGCSAVSLRIFQKNSLVNGSLIDDFLDVLKIEDDPRFYKEMVRNKSLSADGANLMLIANQLFEEFSADLHDDWLYGQKFRKDFAKFFQSGPPISQLLSESTLAAISEIYGSSNAELADLLRPELHGSLFETTNLNASQAFFARTQFISAEFVEWLVQIWKAAHPA